MFVTGGKNIIRDWLSGGQVSRPTYAAIGSIVTTEAGSSTGLLYEIDRLRRPFDSLSIQNQQVEFEMIVPSTEPVGAMPIYFREIGIFNGSPTGSMFSRSAFAEIEKTEDIEFQTITAFRII